jgi:hypothetical protein
VGTWLYAQERAKPHSGVFAHPGNDPSRKKKEFVVSLTAGFVVFEDGAAPQAVKARPCGRLCRYPHLSPGRKTGLQDGCAALRVGDPPPA